MITTGPQTWWYWPGTCIRYGTAGHWWALRHGGFLFKKLYRYCRGCGMEERVK